ncbi:type II secretion system protein GspE [Erwinia amylovora]|uniref:General secretion pathway protein E n=4 Tax=Erwinia amylovora TaxID=552 RepID=A0A831EUH3_ERWAM|nr:type II secretion system protein GspE [Erwinia amylovora]CBX81744.1 General secretion pathway protein E [Erwinia amylovora ATCC BAA-2158]CCP04132.1 General secretion pathway protein E [Erwinia amylovora Ea644]CDK16229.1 General secretion pathway protein E [Erwinia amylovora LA635]CDK19595.1 General secretion pathway protein E [Erwinia amylovora LA636]CDK22967.1 General secretion pathway protein E [Erwinia amylovora LA637]
MTPATQRAVEAICQAHQAIIVEFNAQRLHIAVAETPSHTLMAELRFAAHCPIEVECWPKARLEQSHQREKLPDLAAAEDGPEHTGTAVEIINALLVQALQKRASDIHIEPQEGSLRLRLRVDGVLQHLPLAGVDNSAPLIARLKILASLDISERRVPQDGQFSLLLKGHNESFRLSTLPTRFGEKAVVRLLQSDSHAIALENLGMPGSLLKRYREALARPQGMILVTGPTGSGKTFTLYSGLSWLNIATRNLCSVEDPVEIPMVGVNQTQIHAKSGLDFQRVLRALLRQDPDVIMIGEIRDGETAEIAIKAAQTGHLVLSTLHTNSTTETLVRLGQMGVPGYLLASALKLVIAQRLVRKLCPHCRQPATAVSHFPPHIWPGTVQNWLAVGCERCFSGFYGRLALFELLPISARLQNALAKSAQPEELAKIARQQGMNTLFVEGLHCVNRGETTLEELTRVAGGSDG